MLWLRLACGEGIEIRLLCLREETPQTNGDRGYYYYYYYY
jgi:hypothetical protein